MQPVPGQAHAAAVRAANAVTFTAVNASIANRNSFFKVFHLLSVGKLSDSGTRVDYRVWSFDPFQASSFIA